jgi:hypothetical protein
MIQRRRGTTAALAITAVLTTLSTTSWASTGATLPPTIKATYATNKEGPVLEGGSLDPRTCRAFATGYRALLTTLSRLDAVGLATVTGDYRTSGSCRWDAAPNELGLFDAMWWSIEMNRAGTTMGWTATACPSGRLEGTDADGVVTFRCLVITRSRSGRITATPAPVLDTDGRPRSHYIDVPQEFWNLQFPMHVPATSNVHT